MVLWTLSILAALGLARFIGLITWPPNRPRYGPLASRQ
jgi:hypothetical protein